MKFLGQFPVGFFNLVGWSRSRNSKNSVEVTSGWPGKGLCQLWGRLERATRWLTLQVLWPESEVKWLKWLHFEVPLSIVNIWQWLEASLRPSDLTCASTRVERSLVHTADSASWRVATLSGCRFAQKVFGSFCLWAFCACVRMSNLPLASLFASQLLDVVCAASYTLLQCYSHCYIHCVRDGQGLMNYNQWQKEMCPQSINYLCIQAAK